MKKEIKWDVKRGAQIYNAVYDERLKIWIQTGKVKRGEVFVWRSGFSGWRRPEELDELNEYFEKYKQAARKKRKDPKKRSKKPKRNGLVKERKKIKDILVIDDEKDLCAVLQRVLEAKGYSVQTSNTAKEAIWCIKKARPDLVFLDLRLPDGDGIKLLSKIRKASPKTIINIITAYGSQLNKEAAKKKGVSNFIDKPFIEEDIIKAIERSQ